MSRTVGKSIIKNRYAKTSQKLHDHAKRSAVNALKNNSKKVIKKKTTKKTAEATADLIGNKVAGEITKKLKTFTTE